MITYHIGDAALPDIEGRLAIAHIVNDVGTYSKGFAADIARYYPRARTEYQRWATGEAARALPFRLGAIQWVAVGREVGRGPWSGRWVVNMVAQHGLRSAINPHPLHLGALAECLMHLAEEQERTIVMPRIGCGLAGGNWGEVEPIVAEMLQGRDVHVYDLPDTAMVPA